MLPNVMYIFKQISVLKKVNHCGFLATTFMLNKIVMFFITIYHIVVICFSPQTHVTVLFNLGFILNFLHFYSGFMCKNRKKLVDGKSTANKGTSAWFVQSLFFSGSTEEFQETCVTSLLILTKMVN